MDTLVLPDERHRCVRRSRVVLTHQGRCQVREVTPRVRRWQKSLVTGENAKETVKTIAQGMPVIRL
jgi:hypothetical protein